MFNLVLRSTSLRRCFIPFAQWRIYTSTTINRKDKITALFTNMQILKSKSQLTIGFFAAVNHLDGPVRKQNFTLTGSKGHGFWFVIGGFRSVLCVSVFQSSLLVIVIMIDGSQIRIRMFVKSSVNVGYARKVSQIRVISNWDTKKDKFYFRPGAPWMSTLNTRGLFLVFIIAVVRPLKNERISPYAFEVIAPSL